MNLYTEFTFLSFDRIAFAHSLSAANYKYTLQNHGYGIYGETPDDGGVLEIGFVEQNPLVLTIGAQEYRIGENCIFVVPPNCSFSVCTENPGLHRHTSVEFLLSCQCKSVSSCPPSADNVITLPLIIPPCQESTEIFALIRSIVRTKNAHSSRSFFEESSLFMQLLHKLSILARNIGSTNTISPGNRRYCDRAKIFISENMDRRITVSEVAEAVGVSKNYLTNVFSNNEGIPLVEYINRRKLSYMVELMRRYHYTLSEAGEHVGYSDVNYISRIFKRYYGMTITEYRRAMSQQDSSVQLKL